LCRQFPQLPVQTFIHKTPEIVELSKTCISVSGSVSLELLYRVKPTVIVYGMNRLMAKCIRALLKAKYVTLVNLLADQMLYPEFTGEYCEPTGIADATLRWLNDDRAFADISGKLVALREQVARPGACARAALRMMEVLARSSVRAA
jgi:lipid-A-disaccharide synthase